jgi:hypothetical protein
MELAAKRNTETTASDFGPELLGGGDAWAGKPLSGMQGAEFEVLFDEARSEAEDALAKTAKIPVWAGISGVATE